MIDWQLIMPDGRVFPLTGQRFRVGRDADNEIILEDDGVSRHHALIILGEGKVLLLDQRSSNGTFVNGIPVRQAILDDGDEIGFGNTARIRIAASGARGSQSAAMGKLAGMGHEVTLEDGAWRLGRDTECDIPIDHPDVSRLHAELRVTGGQVFLRDNGSTNGTFVNGERVDSALLTDGDRLAFGPCAFVYQAMDRQGDPPRVATRNPSHGGSTMHTESVTRPAPPASQPEQRSGNGALAWIMGILLVILATGGWWAYDEGLFGGAGIEIRDNRNRVSTRHDPAAAEAQRKRREAEQLQRQVAALAVDVAFFERLGAIRHGSETSVQYLVPVAQGLTRVVQAVDQLAAHRLGQAMLKRANLERLPDQLRGLERDMEGLVSEIAKMGSTTAMLQQRLVPLRGGGDKQTLQAIGPSARDAARQAAALSGGIGRCRRQIEQNVQMVRQAADMAIQLRIPLASLLHDFSEPAAAAAEHLRQLERLIDTDLENFRLLERAASAAAAL